MEIKCIKLLNEKKEKPSNIFVCSYSYGSHETFGFDHNFANVRTIFLSVSNVLRTFIKIISILDEEKKFQTAVGCNASYPVKIIWWICWFCIPSLIWDTAFLFLWSPKVGCYSTSHYSSCSSIQVYKLFGNIDIDMNHINIKPIYNDVVIASSCSSFNTYITYVLHCLQRTIPCVTWSFRTFINSTGKNR